MCRTGVLARCVALDVGLAVLGAAERQQNEVLVVEQALHLAPVGRLPQVCVALLQRLENKSTTNRKGEVERSKAGKRRKLSYFVRSVVMYNN